MIACRPSASRSCCLRGVPSRHGLGDVWVLANLLPPQNATGNYVKVVQRIPVKIVFDKGETSKRLLVPGMSAIPTILIR